MKTELQGPFAEARDWLLRYMSTVRFKNDGMEKALEADWSDLTVSHASYLLGALWGRLRQMDSSLEQAKEYGRLVKAELDDEPGA